MLVFEVITPGTWLEYGDKDWAHKIGHLLRILQMHFFQANVALNMFQNAQMTRLPFPTREERFRDSHRKSEIAREVEQERVCMSLISVVDRDEIRFEAEVRFKREKWSCGKAPQEFDNVTQLIYARAFVYAFDAFEKLLGVISKEAGIPSKVAEMHAQFLQDFPTLRKVRDSAHHIEDRVRGLDRNKRPLELKPVMTKSLKAPGGGCLVSDMLFGSRYASTMEDGHCGEVDVSPESMVRLKKIFDGVLGSFSWRGPKQHWPLA